MSSKWKVLIFIIAGLILAGFFIYDFIAGDIGYRTGKLAVVIFFVIYILYTFFSKNKDSKLD
ncbi:MULTISPECIES: hypothetical protein [Halobacillus]|uniref:Uncharacterized protein n=2 Tax=Halobacillus TaxID=45667 RepID=A0A1H0UXH5_HALAD|nr:MULTISPECIES: hypothetical protein [Halobacillus]REJ09976.1 hypothetical protein DYE48_07675 [Halobacillus trueperi]SDP70783.1 hypothetical protein SAMN05421677_12914 [Halobacillus aidingensis]